MPKWMAPDCWCCKIPCLPIVVVEDSVWVSLCYLSCWHGGTCKVGDLFQVEVRSVIQDLIWYVEHMVLPNVPVKGWIIGPYVHSLLDGPGEGMQLSTHSGEIVQLGMMTWGVSMDKDSITQKSGVINRYQCDRFKCEEEYIREFAGIFGERLKEHLRAPSALYDYAKTSGHISFRQFLHCW